MADITYFIADLHLDASHPEIGAIFNRFLSTQALEADALYILGDLFEYWVGDDQPNQAFRPCVTSLQKLSKNNIPVYLMHGNRDFLIGNEFASATGITLLPETHIIELYGTRTLLMHGDTLCTDDTDYQQLRSLLRNSQWQSEFLEKSLQQRQEIAEQLRQHSKQATQLKAEDITDVNQQEVIRTMKEFQVQLLIHGHTHRPDIHHFDLDGEPAQRIVLADWYVSGSSLYVEPTSTGPSFATIKLS